MVYSVYTTESFKNEISNLSDFDKKVIQKIYQRLKENP